MAKLHLSVLVLLYCFLHGSFSSKVTLLSNGYDGLVVAINPEIPEDPQLVESLKSVLTEASAYLYQATAHRAYFRYIKILVPESWTNGTYETATQESYVGADVLVANPNPARGNLPYTLQYGGCGQRGQYIHLTPDYVKLQKFVFDTGPKGKAVVHEWAHYWWGVFDESPTWRYPTFYLQESRVAATRCPASLEGTISEIDYETGSLVPCPLDPETFLPKSSCVFVPLSQQSRDLHTSLMSHQYLDSASGFCHSNHSDPANVHNIAAPNEQNRLCNLRSTWDVILDSVDFANGMNTRNDSITDTTPNITVVQTQSSKYVLVMDVSGSMRGNRLRVLKRAAGLFVTRFATNSSLVGLVSFHSQARKLRDLHYMDSNSTRTDFNEQISRLGAGGGTNIAAGISEGLEVLKGRNQEYSCSGNLIVLTDGQGNTNGAYERVMDCGARMYSLFLDLNSVSANQIMTEISADSGGDWFFASSSSDSNEIISIFQTLSQTDNGNTQDTTYQIHSASFSSAKDASNSITIDSTVGKDTLFTFTYAIYEPTITLRSPLGCEYSNVALTANTSCPDSPIHLCDGSLLSCEFAIPGIATGGAWLYTISNSREDQDITVTVTSKPPSSNVLPIRVEAFLSLTDVTTRTATVIYAKLSQGFFPVTGATVTAVVTTPSSTEVQISLLDNGAGPDVRRDDGIYSRYYYRFTTPGRYSLRIMVSGTSANGAGASVGSPAAFNPGTILSNGTFVANPNGLSSLPNNTFSNATSPVENFERVTSGGSISYSGPTTTDDSIDVFAPSTISDLRAKQDNISNLEENILVEVTFTAPGDDFDEGKATAYEIRYSLERPNQLLNEFNSTNIVNQSEMVRGNLSQPQESSNTETFIFKLKSVAGNSSRLYVAAKAYDEVGHASEVSNVDAVTILLTRNVLPTSNPPEGRVPNGIAETSSSTTTNAISLETVAPQDTPLLGYQIGLGVLGLATVILGIALVATCVKLRSRQNVPGNKGSGDRNVYENPYA